MKHILSLLICLITIAANGQDFKWINPIQEGAYIHGQGWEELRSTYVRLPDKAESTVRKPLWDLSRNSAGLSIVFRSNAKSMCIRYSVSGNLNMFHMPTTGVSGIDMYVTDSEGKIRWCAPDFAVSFSGDTIRYNYGTLTYYPEGSTYYEYHIYLPLYNTVKFLEIGIPEDAEISLIPFSGKPIVIYGTSIAQGACASRPGMAWTNIVQRELNYPTVNLGFSGNGKLEPALFNLLSEIDASAYIIDCMPNMRLKDSIENLILDGVKILREKHSCPIIIVEHSGYMNEVTNQTRAFYRELNQRLEKGYKLIKDEHISNVFYMRSSEIGMKMDDMVEGIHPTDLGMRHHADGHIKKLKKVLKL